MLHYFNIKKSRKWVFDSQRNKIDLSNQISKNEKEVEIMSEMNGIKIQLFSMLDLKMDTLNFVIRHSSIIK